MTLNLKRMDHFALLIRVLAGFPLQSCKRLNLSNNRLSILHQLETLVPIMPNLEALNLSNNNIHQWDDFTCTQKWPLKLWF